MTELLGSLDPTTRAVVLVAAAVLGYAILVELGVYALLAGVAAFAYLHLPGGGGWPTSGAVAGAVAAALAWYVAESVVKPNAPCVWCKGAPRRGLNSRGRWRGCFVCGGSGRRHPLGSKVLRRNRRFLGTGD